MTNPIAGGAAALSGIKLIDKWMLEHGSAALQKEYNEYLRQKIVDLASDHAKEVAKMEAAHAEEVNRLNLQHGKAMEELEAKYEGEVQRLKAHNAPTKSRLSEDEEQLLLLISELGHNAYLEGIAFTLGWSMPKAEVVIDNLIRRRFASAGFSDFNGRQCSMLIEGSRYLVENGLA